MENFDLENFNSQANFEDAGGLGRWVIIAIIITVVIVVSTIVFFVAKYLNQRTRDSGELVADVSRSIVETASTKHVNRLVDLAVRASAEESLLNANVETGKALFAIGEATEDDVLNAVVAAEMSKTAVAEKNRIASIEFEKLRSEELAKADMVVAAAVADKARASQAYAEFSSDIAKQNIQRAEEVLLEVTRKRQAADKEYQSALEMRTQAEKNAKERLDTTVNTKRGIVAAAQKQLEAIKKRMNDARERAAKLQRERNARPPTPKPPAPKPPAPKPPTPKPPTPKPPTPKPPTPKPPAPLKCGPGFVPIKGVCKRFFTPPPTPPRNPGNPIVTLLKSKRFVINKGTYPGNGGRRDQFSAPIPKDMNTSALLEFDIFMTADIFKGCQGKIGGLMVNKPGVRGGSSGCLLLPERTGASYRVMFGKPETKNIYQYIYFHKDTQDKQKYDYLRKMENCGYNGFVNEMKNVVKLDSWNTVKMGLKLNTPGQANGLAMLNVNGREFTQDGVMWIPNDQFKITELNLHGFFGGCGSNPVQYRLPDTYFEIRDARVSKWI